MALLANLPILSIILALVVYGLEAGKVPDEDLIKSLPRVPFQYNFTQYAGYLNATGTGATSPHYFYYWLTESQSKTPDKDPLVVWFTGGPGCSSVGGLFEELGPFRVSSTGETLTENRFSWNKGANVLFIESPAGVGFSYAEDGNINATDDTVASDNLAALLNFFAKFEKYQGRQLIITGESYAGVYIPMLAAEIVGLVQQNKFPANFSGIAIGNGIMSYKENSNSLVHLMYYRGVIDYDKYQEINEACCNNKDSATCNYNLHTKVSNNPPGDIVSDSSKCGNLTTYIVQTLMSYSLNDQYNQYQDCYQGSLGLQGRLKKLHSIQYPQVKYPIGDSVPDLARIINYDSTDPEWGYYCYQDDVVQKFLNHADVKTAIHAKNVTWFDCTNSPNFHYTVTTTDQSAAFATILSDPNVRILIYNGDVDSTCNFLGAEWFMRNVAKYNNLQSVGKRSAWMYRGQIAGYVKQYQRVDVLTVKGSGHFVPLDRAGPALQMLTNFIQNQNYSIPVQYNLTLGKLTTS